MITRLSIAFEDFPGSSIASQVMPPCIKVKDGLEIRLGSGIAPDRSIEVKMLPRQKCETLANYYLGFNGWSGKVQYHKQEETEEGKVDKIIDGLDCLFLKVKVVSIARLDFPQSGLYCEGAGMAEAELTSVEQKGKVSRL